MNQSPEVKRSAFEKVIALSAILDAAGTAGRAALQLADKVGYQGTDASKREQLARDIRHLRRIGLDIERRQEPGQETHYVLHPRDARVRLAFSDSERAELARAAIFAGAPEITHHLDRTGAAGARSVADDLPAADVRGPALPADIDQIIRAVSANCRVSFNYSGSPRVVAPLRVVPGYAGWDLDAYEPRSEKVKTFDISRMIDVRIGDPDSAPRQPEPDRPGTPRPSSEHPGQDPLTWQLDPPVSATIEVPARYLVDVTRLLLIPMPESWQIPDDPDHDVPLTSSVTNHALFLARIIELGERVRLLGPESLRSELRQRLDVLLIGAPASPRAAPGEERP